MVADEDPNLIRFALGRMLGIDAIDRFTLGLAGLDREFIHMVQHHKIDIRAVARAAWPDQDYRIVPIWSRLGYCLVSRRP